MLFKNIHMIVLAMAFLMQSNPAHAILEIQITEGVEGEVPIAIVPFGSGELNKSQQDISAIVSADLARTGKFKLISERNFLETPHHGGEVNFENWRILGVENLVVGRFKSGPDGKVQVQFQLFDIFKRGNLHPDNPDYKAKQLAGYSLPLDTQDARRIAHKISDIIYQKLTGEQGAFSTRIAYVIASGPLSQPHYSLRVADSDGYNAVTVVESNSPLMSPSWSADGLKLAYVSFENDRSGIYVQQLRSGQRQLVSQRKGINGAPSWSPDGRSLAVSLSFSGDPEIYILRLDTKKLDRVTYNTAIDTEPAWAPDGRSIVFTSDRSGQPQLYQSMLTGERPKRLTYEGRYNADAQFSPDGKSLVMVHGVNGQFRIAVLDLTSKLLNVVSDGRLDESPGFAPNGSMLLYASEFQRRGILFAVSVDGRVSHRLVLQQGDVREPAWGPFTGGR